LEGERRVIAMLNSPKPAAVQIAEAALLTIATWEPKVPPFPPFEESLIPEIIELESARMGEQFMNKFARMEAEKIVREKLPIALRYHRNSF
jgi:hypothetical protein